MENTVVLWKGTNITNHVISATRDLDICTGVGTLDLVIEGKTNYSFSTWDTIVLEEDDEEVGKFYICSHEKQAPGGVYIITAQDESKKLSDYFIDTQLQPETVTRTRYWIETILDMVNINYYFHTTSDGELVSMETALGMQPAYNSIMTLLQLSGWYMYFDASGTCHIGPLEVPSTPSAIFRDNQIIELKTSYNDAMLRNKAIVWGYGDYETGSWIYAVSQTSTGWDRDDGEDYRTVLYSSSSIMDWDTAQDMADKIVDTFSDNIPEKFLTVAGLYPDIALGNRISAVSSYGSFSGMVTGIVTNIAEDGAVTTFNIDKKCPRLFGYATYPGEETNYERVSEITPYNYFSIGYYQPKTFTPPIYTASGIETIFSNTGNFFSMPMLGRDGYILWDNWKSSQTDYYQPGILREATASGIIPASGVIFERRLGEDWSEYLAYNSGITLLDDARVLSSIEYWPDETPEYDDARVYFSIRDFDSDENTIVADISYYNEEWCDYYFQHYVTDSNLLVIAAWEQSFEGTYPMRFNIWVYNLYGTNLLHYTTEWLEINGLFQYPATAPTCVDDKVYFCYYFNNYDTLAEDEENDSNSTAIVLEVNTTTMSVQYVRPRYTNTCGIAFIKSCAYDSHLEKLVMTMLTYTTTNEPRILMFIEPETLAVSFSDVIDIYGTSSVLLGLIVDSYNLVYVVVYNYNISDEEIALFYCENLETELFTTGIDLYLGAGAYNSMVYDYLNQPPRICNIIDEDGRFWYSYNGNLYGINILNPYEDVTTVIGGFPDPYYYPTTPSRIFQLVYLVGGQLYVYNHGGVYGGGISNILYKVGMPDV